MSEIARWIVSEIARKLRGRQRKTVAALNNMC